MFDARPVTDVIYLKDYIGMFYTLHNVKHETSIRSLIQKLFAIRSVCGDIFSNVNLYDFEMFNTTFHVNDLLSEYQNWNRSNITMQVHWNHIKATTRWLTASKFDWEMQYEQLIFDYSALFGWKQNRADFSIEKSMRKS